MKSGSHHLPFGHDLYVCGLAAVPLESCLWILPICSHDPFLLVEYEDIKMFQSK